MAKVNATEGLLIDPMLPSNRSKLNQMWASYQSNIEKAGGEAKWQEKAEKKMMDMHAGGKELAQAWNSFRIIPVSRLIQETNLVGMSWFEEGTYDENSIPIIVNKNPLQKSISFRWVGSGGGTYESGPIEYGAAQQVTPQWIDSDKISYTEDDLWYGNLASVGQENNQRLADSWTIKADKLQWALVQSAFGAFPSDTATIMDDRIKNFPTNNIVDCTASHYGAGFSPDVIKAVILYCINAGVSLRNIYIPITAQKDLWDWVNIVAGFNLPGAVMDPNKTVPTGVREAIWNKGTTNNMLGVYFNIIPLQILHANGEAFFTTNNPIGFWWKHKQGDKVYTEDTRINNRMLTIKLSKKLAHAIPSPMRPNGGKVIWNLT